MAPCQYSPLKKDEIRLLYLSSRQSGSLHVRIEAKRLSSPKRPGYEALSYVWGSTQDPYDLTIEQSRNHRSPRAIWKNLKSYTTVLKRNWHPWGALNQDQPKNVMKFNRKCRDSQTLGITPNLAEALPYLQLETETRVLWIDAICINQGDSSEKSHQVKRMADIFQMADRVLIWMGAAYNYAELAVSTWAHLASQIEVDFGTGTVRPAEKADPRWSNIEFEFPYDDMTWESLNNFCQNEWFERLWVWQEAHARPDDSVVLAGCYTIPWKDLRKAVICIRMNITWNPLDKLDSDAVQRAYLISLGHENLSWEWLLELTNESKCTDKRDKVFALLGMMSIEDQLGIEPDYTKSISEVYLDFFLQQFADRKSLELLRFCSPSNEPSWIPDLSRKHDELIQIGRASLSAPGEAIHTSKGTLNVLGVDVGTVGSSRSLDGLKGGGSSWNEWFSAFSSLLPSSERSEEAMTDEGSELESLIRVLCGNTFEDSYEPPDTNMPNYENVRLSVLSSLPHSAIQHQGNARPDYAEETTHLSASVMLYQTHISATTKGRQLLQLEGGLLVLGPEDARQGDKLCVILGCRRPFLLRSVSPERWKVIGESFTTEIAHGEALVGVLPTGYQSVEQMTPSGVYHTVYTDMRTGRRQIEDPRLTELPAGWTLEQHDQEEYQQIFYHEESDEVSWRDPRLFPEALRARGVKLQTFNLV